MRPMVADLSQGPPDRAARSGRLRRRPAATLELPPSTGEVVLTGVAPLGASLVNDEESVSQAATAAADVSHEPQAAEGGDQGLRGEPKTFIRAAPHPATLPAPCHGSSDGDMDGAGAIGGSFVAAAAVEAAAVRDTMSSSAADGGDTIAGRIDTAAVAPRYRRAPLARRLELRTPPHDTLHGSIPPSTPPVEMMSAGALPRMTLSQGRAARRAARTSNGAMAAGESPSTPGGIVCLAEGASPTRIAGACPSVHRPLSTRRARLNQVEPEPPPSLTRRPPRRADTYRVVAHRAHVAPRGSNGCADSQAAESE